MKHKYISFRYIKISAGYYGTAHKQVLVYHQQHTTSLLHQNNVTALFWCYNDVVNTSRVLWEELIIIFLKTWRHGTCLCEKALQSRNTKLHITFNKFIRKPINGILIQINWYFDFGKFVNNQIPYFLKRGCWCAKWQVLRDITIYQN